MLRRIVAGLTLGTVAVLAAPLSAEVDWMAKVPGVHVLTADSTAAHVNETFSLDRTVSASIRQGLKSHGWTLDADTEAVGVSSMRAHRGAMHLQVSIAAGTMAVNLVNGDNVPIGPGGGIISGGNGVVINDGNLNETLECHGDMVLNGSNCTLHVHGDVQQLVVNGSNNHLDIASHLTAITMDGSNNTVNWSSHDNPSPPRIINNGSHNDMGPKLP